MWDADGNRYLDFFGGILTTISGHAVPEVVDAVARAGREDAAHLDALPQPRRWSSWPSRSPALSGIPDAKVFFTTSGTEANDAALLLATSYRRSNQILALRNSYHGRSFATIAITGNRSWSPTSLSPLQVYVRARRLPAAQPVPRARRRRVHRRVRAGPARRARQARAATSPA